MIHLRYIILSLSMLLMIASCQKESYTNSGNENHNIQELCKANQSKISVKQGVAGTLIMKEGNCMPMIGNGENPNPCLSYPVERTIQVYEPTSPEEAEGRGPSFEEVHTKLVVETNSDEDGFFQVELDTGRYSLFIIEKGRYYRNMLKDNLIGPVTVEIDSVTIENPVIDYAVY
ncbi:MAG: hypothetical protein K9J27_10470 [Bacteroidales bacterium]|nr:hypothetical protein [Bacteroidales bacterium]MCF8334246.1 hypothetical protein [Bacteroidales bacterium]